jgi:hypothetical protein
MAAPLGSAHDVPKLSRALSLASESSLVDSPKKRSLMILNGLFRDKVEPNDAIADNDGRG